MGGRSRIEFLNVQGLTVAKSLEIRNLMMVSGRDGSEREVILGLVETHEKSMDRKGERVWNISAQWEDKMIKEVEESL